VNGTIGRTLPPLQRVKKWKNNSQQITPLTHMLHITYSSTVGKLPNNIIRCKAYGITNAQSETCKMLNGS